MSTYEILIDAVCAGNIEKVNQVLSRLTKSRGWHAAFEMLKQALGRVFGHGWFAKNRFLLALLDCEELIGYDGDVEGVLETAQVSRDFDKVKSTAMRMLIKATEQQIASFGSTLFFDLERMADHSTCVLVNDISRARLREFIPIAEKLIREYYGDRSVFLGDPASNAIVSVLWKTAYGFNLLRSVYSSENATIHDLVTGIQNLEYGADTDSVQDSDYVVPRLSRRLEMLVDSLARSKWSYQSEQELKSILGTGYVDPILLLRDVTRTEHIRKDARTEFTVEDTAVRVQCDYHALLDMILEMASARRHPELARLVSLGLSGPAAWKDPEPMSHHRRMIKALIDCRPKGYEDVIADYVESAVLEWHHEHCHLEGVDPEAFETALDVLSEHRKSKAVTKLHSMLRRALGSDIGLLEYIVNKLVELEGAKATDVLLDSIHLRSQYSGDVILEGGADSRIVNALLKIGPSTIPKALERFVSDSYLDWTYVDFVLEYERAGRAAIMKALAQGPRHPPYLLQDLEWSWSYVGDPRTSEVIRLFERAYDASVSVWPEALLHVLYGLDYYAGYGLECIVRSILISGWMEDLNLDIPTSRLLRALSSNDHSLRSGACLYLTCKPRSSKSIMLALERLVARFGKASRDTFDDELRTALRALAVAARVKHLALLVSHLADIEPPYYDLSIVHPVLGALMKHSRRGVRILRGMFDGGTQSERRSAFFLLALLGFRPEMRELLISEGLDWLVERLSDGDFDKMPSVALDLSQTVEEVKHTSEELGRIDSEVGRRKARAAERKKQKAVSETGRQHNPEGSRCYSEDEPSYYI